MPTEQFKTFLEMQWSYETGSTFYHSELKHSKLYTKFKKCAKQGWHWGAEFKWQISLPLFCYRATNQQQVLVLLIMYFQVVTVTYHVKVQALHCNQEYFFIKAKWKYCHQDKWIAELYLHERMAILDQTIGQFIYFDYHKFLSVL